MEDREIENSPTVWDVFTKQGLRSVVQISRLFFVVNCREALSFVSVTKFFHSGFHFSCLWTHFLLLRDWLGDKSLLKPPLMRSIFP